MSLISQPEQPTGAIDGSNLVFTFANPLNSFLWIRIDGSLYVGTQNFTVGSSVLTLDAGSAPTSSIYAVYYTSPPPVPPPAPTPGKISLSDAYISLKNRLKDIADVPQATFIQWCDFVNKFTYRFILGVDPDRFIKVLPFNIIAGQDTYPLNDDFRDMSTWNTGFFITSVQGDTVTTLSQRLPLSGPGNGYGGYFISRGNFVFTPMPVQNNILTERYVVNQATLSSIDQYFTIDGTPDGIAIIPEEYMMYVVNALADQYAIWDEEPSAESYADARFQRTLDELCDNIRRQTSAMGMLDFSGIYSGGTGYGGYGYGGWV